jgi:lysophospholipase L1-like esterase
MIHYRPFRTLICVLIMMASAGVVNAAEFKPPVESMDLEDGDTLVFLGDSITHQCLYTQYVEDFFYTRFPGKRIRFHNAGVGGAKAWDALERFDRDVAAYKPKYVTILLGMNDGRYQPFDAAIFETYHQDMIQVVDLIKACGAVPVLMTPTMFDARAARLGTRKHQPGKLEFYNSVLAYYGTWLREVAVSNGYGFVDMYGPLNNLTLAERKTDPEFTMIRDSVHPGAAGQIVMAFSIIEDMGLRKPLSNIRILHGEKGQVIARAAGGKVSDLKLTESGLEFSWMANGLPWVLPDEAQLGVDLLHLGHKASREALEIHVLPPGQYELTIDGESIGTFASSALARHIELQSQSKTPQYRQALQVALLNKERNAGPVRNLRGQWSNFQRFARARAQLKQNPANAQFAKQVEILKSKIDGMDEQVQQFERQAREIEDKIFEINQPMPHRYVLKRIADATSD